MTRSEPYKSNTSDVTESTCNIPHHLEMCFHLFNTTLILYDKAAPTVDPMPLDCTLFQSQYKVLSEPSSEAATPRSAQNLRINAFAGQAEGPYTMSTYQ